MVALHVLRGDELLYNSFNMSRTGKTAVVTGIARPTGIGYACAHLLLSRGYNVIGIDLQPLPHDSPNPDHIPWVPLNLASAQQQWPSPRAVFLDVDLSQPAAIQAVPQQLQGLGISRVHALVNNAGIVDPYMPPLLPGGGESGGESAAATAGAAAERAARWSQYIAVNLSAPFLLSEALVPLLQPQGEGQPQPGGGEGAAAGGGGSIIHISSTRALQSEPNSEGYAAAKAGLLGLTHAQAASLSCKGIRVNVVLPGWIDTSSPAGSVLRPEDHAWHWSGRVGVPSDVAEMVAFLADDSKAGFITGQQFVVDGGVTKRMTYPE